MININFVQQVKVGRKRQRNSLGPSADEDVSTKKVKSSSYPADFPVGKIVFFENDRRRSSWLPAVVRGEGVWRGRECGGGRCGGCVEGEVVWGARVWRGRVCRGGSVVGRMCGGEDVWRGGCVEGRMCGGECGSKGV